MAAPILSFGQSENKPVDLEKKIAYSFINEYGGFLGGQFGFTGVFVNGIRLKSQDMFGIGVGYEIDTYSAQSIPIYFNYRHYFIGKRNFTPLVNIGVGTRISFWDEWYGYCDPWGCYGEWVPRVAPGLYATVAGGFKVKAFSFTSGFFFKSCGNNFFGGFEIKVGLTY